MCHDKHLYRSGSGLQHNLRMTIAFVFNRVEKTLRFLDHQPRKPFFNGGLMQVAHSYISYSFFVLFYIWLIISVITAAWNEF